MSWRGKFFMSEHEGPIARIQAEASAELSNLGRLKVELQKITAGRTTADNMFLGQLRLFWPISIAAWKRTLK